jgi:hypothetical protein
MNADGADDEEVQAGIDWSWLRRSHLELGCALFFARGVTQDEMFQAFGLNPASARMESLAGGEGLDPARPSVRVGEACGWTFAIDPHLVSLDLAIRARSVRGRLSAATEGVEVTWTAKPTEDFAYWANGTLVTSFEPYRPDDRYGSEPDRFLGEMQQLGMVAEADDDEDDLDAPLIATLNLATLALGIWLPEQVAMGTLPTVTLNQDAR